MFMKLFCHIWSWSSEPSSKFQRKIYFYNVSPFSYIFMPTGSRHIAICLCPYVCQSRHDFGTHKIYALCIDSQWFYPRWPWPTFKVICQWLSVRPSHMIFICTKCCPNVLPKFNWNCVTLTYFPNGTEFKTIHIRTKYSPYATWRTKFRTSDIFRTRKS